MLITPDRTPDADEKVLLMLEDARFDVADDALARPADLSAVRGSIPSPKAPPSVPKVFLSNDCQFNCAYCGCRSDNECRRRYVNTPRGLARIAMRQAKDNGHGVFITSSIYRNANYTQELIIDTLRIIRLEYNYRGFVHAKVMPGAEEGLIYQSGLYADRLSVNIEVAKSEGYQKIAKNKNRDNILTPMGQISRMIQAARQEKTNFSPAFAASQTTQLMAGSTGEDDRTILNLSDALYRKYRLKRVYYTAFQYRHPAAGYEGLPPVSTPQWRMRRLYQADRLMQIYGFGVDDVAPTGVPFLEEGYDPKAAWALRHLEQFPVEVNRAPYETLLRIPGIGTTLARRIVNARRLCALSHEQLTVLGVSLKKSGPFLTCKGRHRGISPDNEPMLRALLADPKDMKGRQLNLLSAM